MIKKLALLTVIAGLIIGCNAQRAPVDNVAADTAGTVVEHPTIEAIPAELKHEGFEYSGLGRTEPLAMEYVDSNNPDTTYTGAQRIVLKEIRDGRPIFSIEHSGNLSVLGVREVGLEQDGIYTVSSSFSKVGERDMELPAQLEPGTTWETRTVVDQGEAQMDITTKRTVKGTESIKTKVGTRDALVVNGTATGSIRGEKANLESTEYYVRGVGVVKSTLVLRYNDGRTQTVTIQETE
jgi:hypothetical protein